MTCDDASPASSGSQERSRRAAEVFGGYDGLCSLLGLVLTLALFGSVALLAMGAVSAAVGSAFSMAQGEYLNEGKTRWATVAAMGFATLAGALAPALPLLISRAWPAFVVAGLLTAAISAYIAHLRPEHGWRSYARVGICLLVGVAAAVLAAVGAAALFGSGSSAACAA